MGMVCLRMMSFCGIQRVEKHSNKFDLTNFSTFDASTLNQNLKLQILFFLKLGFLGFFKNQNFCAIFQSLNY